MGAYHIETDKEKIDKLMRGYFCAVNGVYLRKALKNFSNNVGFGPEFVSIFFKSDHEEYDLAQLALVAQPIDDMHVILEMEYPATDKDTLAYLTFPELYAYLEDKTSQIMETEPDEELPKLLMKVKEGLDV